jgi:outer membrane murein-binding lipoprotein Lpp
MDKLSEEIEDLKAEIIDLKKENRELRDAQSARMDGAKEQ